MGVASIKSPELARRKDQDLFTVRIAMDLPTGTHLRHREGEVRIPETIEAQYRIHQTIENVPLTAFSMGGPSVDAFTGVSVKASKQFTIVAQAMGDGSR